MRKIHAQALAKQDLKNIWLYSFKNWGEKQADCYFDELNAAFALIAENPELGVACDYIREGYRHFHINRHLRYAGSQSPDWEPRMRSSSFVIREAGASVTEFPSLSLGTSENVAGMARSYGIHRA